MAAINKNHAAVKYASERLKNKKKFILDVVELNGLALQNASQVMKEDLEVRGAAFRKNKKSLKYSSLGGVISIVTKNGQYLKYASDEMQDTKSVVLAAVRHDGLALNLHLKKCKIQMKLF